MRRLGGLDSALLEVERHGLPLHTMAILVLDPATVPGGYSFEKLQEFIAARLVLVPPLRRRLVEVPLGIGRPVWVCTEVAIADHVHRSAVPAPGGRRELAELAGALSEEPLSRRLPLWQMHVVEGLEDGRIAIVAKVHHALMDGIAGMEFMASLFSDRPDVGDVVAAGNDAERVPSGAELVLRSFPELAVIPLRAARALGRTAVGSARLAPRVTRLTAGRRTHVLPAPRVPWSAAPTSRRNVAFTEVRLEDVRRIAKGHEVTVNDVLLAVVGDALRRYLRERDALPARSLVAAVPVSVRDEESTAANVFSLMFATLGTDVEDPRERLRLVHQQAHEARALHDALGGGTLVDWSEAIAPMVFSLAGRAIVESHLLARLPLLFNAIVSNVPGPPVTLYFGGARLDTVHPIGPIFDGAGLNITAVSARDTIGIGLASCPTLVPDLWEIADGIDRSVRALARA